MPSEEVKAAQAELKAAQKRLQEKMLAEAEARGGWSWRFLLAVFPGGLVMGLVSAGLLQIYKLQQEISHSPYGDGLDSRMMWPLVMMILRVFGEVD